MKNMFLLISIFLSLFYSMQSYANCSGTTDEIIQCLNTKVSQLESVSGEVNNNLTGLHKQGDTQNTNLNALSQTVTTQAQLQGDALNKSVTQLNRQIQTTGTNANNYADSAITKALPAGTVVAYAGPNIPDGWLLCDGSEKSAASYPNLFNAIGNTYGNPINGSNFILPDYRGLFLRGADLGSENDPDSSARIAYKNIVGAPTGNNLGSYQIDELKKHSHGLSEALITNLHHSDGSSFTVPCGQGSWILNGGVTATETGGNESRPKNISVYYIIKI